MDAQADLSLRWAHMPFFWFCHEPAHLKIQTYNHGLVPDVLVILYHYQVYLMFYEIKNLVSLVFSLPEQSSRRAIVLPLASHAQMLKFYVKVFRTHYIQTL